MVRRLLGGTPAINIFSAMITCIGSRYLAVKNEVKLHTWDTRNDGLGVTVRRKKTTTATTI